MTTNSDKKKIIAISAVAILAASLGTYFAATSYLPSQDPDVVQDDTTLPINTPNLRKGPPPMSLEAWGTKYSSFEQARASSEMASASLPSAVPSDLHLDSVRVQGDESTKFMTAFYLSQGDSTDDSSTFQDVMSRGGIVVVYSIESYSPFDREKWMEAFVSEAPEVRRIETVNGTPAVVNTGNPEEGITYQVLFWDGDLKINLVSIKYTDQDLIRIAETIVKAA